MLKLNYEREPLKLPGLGVNSRLTTLVVEGSTPLFERLKSWLSRLLPDERETAASGARFLALDEPPRWTLLV